MKTAINNVDKHKKYKGEQIMKTQNTNQTKLYPQALTDLLNAEKNTFMQIEALKEHLNDEALSIGKMRLLLSILQNQIQKLSKEEPTLDWAEKCIGLSKKINSGYGAYENFLNYIKTQSDTDKFQKVQIYLECILEHWIEVPANPYEPNKDLIIENEDIVLEFKELFYKELESCFN